MFSFNQIRTALIASLLFPSALSAAVLKSPDGHLEVDVSLIADGVPVFKLNWEGQSVLGTSRLGLVCEDADFSRDLKMTRENPETPVKDDYELLTGKRRLNSYRANRKVYEFATAEGKRMNIVFQVSNDGVGFRYEFPDLSSEPRVVKSEETSFKLPVGTKAWLQPMSAAKSGWAKSNPSYEEYHQQEIDAGTPSTLGAGWIFPALFLSGETWVLLSETDMVRGYCATRLRHESPDNEYRIGFPDPRETIDNEPVNPRFTTPFATPWRVIVAGTLKTVTESTLGTDLAAPAKASGSAVKLAGSPGKSSWSWAKLGDRKTVFDVQRQFIDFAAEMNWSYCLVDAMWDKQIGYDKIKELASYGRSKQIGLLVWYNSNGNWNDAFQTPKNLMADRKIRRGEFARLRDMGVAGVKIDFFGGDGRAFVDLYLDILEDASDYGLLVNLHGSTLPRGLERTYPNLMTMESVRGYEFIVNDQKGADRAPTHMAMLPFTRNIFDPMDFTPLCLADLPRVKRRTTVAAELATAVLFTSGIQHYTETPEGMAKQPDYVRAILKEVPAVWQDSRFLAGFPGKLAVFARRGTDGRWWVAGFNGENTAKTLDIDLGELGHVSFGDVITDSLSGGFDRLPLQMSGTSMKIEMLPYGGFLAVEK